ncbi:MAG: DUF4388 domain-containing protein, partial [bacterium]|nr:DUF4388 domain-containing protein [bacterium]
KPVDFDLLIDLLHKVMRSESGFIKGIALPHFLQLLEMENKTCTLSISCELKQGSLYFINGKLINARYGKYEGKEASFEIVTWEKNVEIAMSDKCHLREKQIQETLGYILLEGFHLKDENQLLSPQNVDVHDEKEPIIEPLTVSEGLHNEISRLMVILGDSLLATEIYRVSDGNSIAAHSTGNQYKANFHTLAIKTDESLKTSGFPGLGRYVLLKLKRNQIAMIILLGDYQWGLLLDSKKTKLGLLLNIILPEITRGFKQWIEG